MDKVLFNNRKVGLVKEFVRFCLRTVLRLMKAKCIDNRYNNSNFTKDKEYEMSYNGVRCDWGGMWTKFRDWDKPNNFDVGSIFEFAMCKFQIICQQIQIFIFKIGGGIVDNYELLLDVQRKACYTCENFRKCNVLNDDISCDYKPSKEAKKGYAKNDQGSNCKNR